MKNFIILSFVFINLSSYGLKKKLHRHKEAHQHGSGSLQIAFEGAEGRIELKTPADTIVGFEHQAKTDIEKQKLKQAIELFSNQISNFIQLDSKLDCQWKAEKIGSFSENVDKKQVKVEHSNFITEYRVSCKKQIIGSSIVFDFTRFPELKDLDVTLLVGDLQKSFEIQGKPFKMEVK